MKCLAVTLMNYAVLAMCASSSPWSGSVGMEWRGFKEESLDPQQHRRYASIVTEFEYYTEWDEGRQQLTLSPFARIDQHDKERTHVDLRELNWLYVADTWEVRVGVSKVFWGVTESQHLVDIINQTDLVENPDGEDKLGQPMLQLSLIHEWNVLELFLLPGFRERIFPSVGGRPRFSLPVAHSEAEYESSREEKHVDAATRWSLTRGDWDIGLAYFHGTSREPRLLPRTDGTTPELVPFYDIIHQTSVDVQTVKGNWLWKVEWLNRWGQEDRFMAWTAGFEYTWVGLFGTSLDLGLLAEHLYDDRGSEATTPFQDDLMMGARLVLNDVGTTEALVSVIRDRHSDSEIYKIEASRRIGDHFKVNLESSIIRKTNLGDLLHDWREDDYVQFSVGYYF